MESHPSAERVAEQGVRRFAEHRPYRLRDEVGRGREVGPHLARESP